MKQDMRDTAGEVRGKLINDVSPMDPLHTDIASVWLTNKNLSTTALYRYMMS